MTVQSSTLMRCPSCEAVVSTAHARELIRVQRARIPSSELRAVTVTPAPG